jgi:translation initiation factor 6
MTHIYVTDFAGNPSVGLFVYATDSYCLVGESVPDRNVEQIKDALDVPVHQLNIAGTSLLGVFLAGNEKTLLVPSIAFSYELEKLDELKIPYKVIDTKLTALGNNIVTNEKGALLNKEFEDNVKNQIAKVLDVPVLEEDIFDQSTVGSCLLLTKKGGIIHKEASDDQIDNLIEFFGVDIDVATVNRGAPQVASGVIANSNGLIVGKLSSGIEVTNVDELLGFLENAQ